MLYVNLGCPVLEEELFMVLALVLALVGAAASASEIPDYGTVLTGYQDRDYFAARAAPIRLEAEAFSRQGGGRALVSDENGARTVSAERAGHWLEWRFSVSRRGQYALALRYRVPPVASTERWSIDRTISLDGVVPFRQLVDYSFMDAWTYSREEYNWRLQNYQQYGEKPEYTLRLTEQMTGWQIALLLDRETEYIEPFLFLLETGLHTLRIEAGSRPAMFIDWLEFRPYRKVRPYAEVEADYRRDGRQPVHDVLVKIQAEDYGYQDRNVPSRGWGGTFDNPAVLLARNSADPPEGYNAVGIWRRYNHSLLWDFEVPETGLYKMVIRYTQDQDSLMRREIRIDGEVPFAELSPWTMRGTGGRLNTPPALTSDISRILEGYYDLLKWKQVPVGREIPRGKSVQIEPFLFYLEKGPHVLQMRAVLGPERVRIKRAIDGIRGTIAEYYVKVKEAIGRYRSLDEAIADGLDLRTELPGIVPACRTASRELDEISRRIVALVPPGREEEEAGPTVSVLRVIREDLDAVVRNPNVLLAPEQFDAGYIPAGSGATGVTTDLTITSQGNFEARVLNRLYYTSLLYEDQPTEIDWIAFASPDLDVREPVPPWFSNLAYLWREFVRSFRE